MPRHINLLPSPCTQIPVHPTPSHSYTPHPLLNDTIFGFMTKFEFPPIIFALSNSLVLFIHTCYHSCILFFAICRAALELSDGRSFCVFLSQSTQTTTSSTFSLASSSVCCLLVDDPMMISTTTMRRRAEEEMNEK